MRGDERRCVVKIEETRRAEGKRKKDKRIYEKRLDEKREGKG